MAHDTTAGITAHVAEARLQGASLTDLDRPRSPAAVPGGRAGGHGPGLPIVVGRHQLEPGDRLLPHRLTP